MIREIFGLPPKQRMPSARPLFFNVWFLVAVASVIVLLSEGVDYWILWQAQRALLQPDLGPEEMKLLLGMVAEARLAAQEAPSTLVTAFVASLGSLLLAFRPNGEAKDPAVDRIADSLENDAERLEQGSK